MCTAGDLETVRGGSDHDNAREEGTAPSAPAQASVHKGRVFVSLGSCVVPCFSLVLIDVLLFLCIRWYVQSVVPLVREEFKSIFRFSWHICFTLPPPLRDRLNVIMPQVYTHEKYDITLRPCIPSRPTVSTPPSPPKRRNRNV